MERVPTPTNVIDIGGARGYTAKVLTDVFGVPTTVMEKSQHCFHTRAVKDFVLHDIYDFPYPFKNHQFDLAYSNSVLEHMTYEDIDDVIRELARISKRGFHAIGYKSFLDDYGNNPSVFFGDGTHIIYETFEWWEKKFHDVAPGYEAHLPNAYRGTTFKVPFVKNDLLKLNLGCGFNIFGSGWVNMDKDEKLARICPDPFIFKHHDITHPLPYEDNTCDHLFLGNILEALDMEQGIALLSECKRVLKPGATMRIAVIDSELLMRKYLSDDLDFLKNIYYGVEHAPCPIAKLAYALFEENNSIWDKCLLRQVLTRAGFKSMVETNPWDSLTHLIAATTIISYPTISFVLEVSKS
jgi:predicted SAM-dependent methyltransferase